MPFADDASQRLQDLADEFRAVQPYVNAEDGPMAQRVETLLYRQRSAIAHLVPESSSYARDAASIKE